MGFRLINANKLNAKQRRLEEHVQEREVFAMNSELKRALRCK